MITNIIGADIPFGSSPEIIELDKQTAIQLYKFLLHEYVNPIDYPLVLKLIQNISDKYPDALSR